MFRLPLAQMVFLFVVSLCITPCGSQALAADATVEDSTTASAKQTLETEGDVAEQKLLTIGSDAPALDVEHWVQDGDGTFKPVTKFEKDKVYVVEFWATWCPPCVASMPHISKLQQDYADQGVQFIAISDEPLETVEGFLEKPTRDDPDVSYGEITKHYCLTTDPDRSVSNDYMKAAKQNGIPTAFIVGKDSHIEWIGHPMQIDDPLQQVVADAWDRVAFLETFKFKQEMSQTMEQVMSLVHGEKFDEARKTIADLQQRAPNDDAKAEITQMSQWIESAILNKIIEGDEELALKQLDKVFGTDDEENASTLFQVAMQLGSKLEAGVKISPKVVGKIATLIEKSLGDDVAAKVEKDQMAVYLLHSLAQLRFHQGDVDKAIELQATVVESVEAENREYFQDRLEHMKAAKESENSGDKATAEEKATG